MADAPILLDGVTTLYALFRERVRRTPGATAYLHAQDKGWKALTWGEMGQRVVQLRERLAPFAGERMAIWMRNGPEWIACDQAALSLGMAVVPLYNEDRPENIAYILKDAGVRLLVVQDQKRLKRLEPFIEGLSLTCLAAHDLPPWGGSASRLPEGEEGELATLIYTSGTTGNPKGVMLTHRNILWVCSRALQVLQVFPQDRFLSILPFSHALERAGSYIIPMMAGAQVAFNRSIPLLREDLQAVRPTVMIAVPRLFERLYMRVEKGLSSHPLKKRVFQAAASVGWRRFLLQQGRGQWHPGLLLHSLLDRLAGRPFRAQMGGRLRVVVSGGAPLPLPVARLFIGLGLPILQGYGLTEASPVISVNTLEDNDPESVGRPLPGWEVRIGEGGELCVRGGGVMKGYWRRPEDTARAIDPEGWLHTGDVAQLRQGRLYIVGRIKDIIVLSNGEKVPPEDLEQAIALDPWFLQAMVVGEGKPFLVAVVVLNREAWGEMAAGLDPDGPGALEDEGLKRRVLQRLNARLKSFPSYARIRGVILTLEPWTLEEGLLTPTLKLKRYRLMERFGAAIEDLYRSALLQRAT